MRGGFGNSAEVGFPRPGKVLKVVMLGLFALWLTFALALNWGGASPELFFALCGSTDRILHGEIWRLVTASLMHVPSGTPWHIVGSLLGLYFLAPSLEREFGPARFARFLALSAVLAYSLQMLVERLLPASVASKLVGEYWFGSLPVLEAIAIAWALNFKGQTVRLMFVLPVSSRGLIIFVVAMSVLYVVVGAQQECGLIAPFGGMLSGWIFGGGTPSPARRWWLKYRLARLDREAGRAKSERKQRVRGSGLRVIAGGAKDEEGKSSPRGSSNGGKGGRGPDGNLLN
ncbi:MAG TPA: rhomboid family intramembrane serine protease [Polyangiaceae bacterium]